MHYYSKLWGLYFILFYKKNEYFYSKMILKDIHNIFFFFLNKCLFNSSKKPKKIIIIIVSKTYLTVIKIDNKFFLSTKSAENSALPSEEWITRTDILNYNDIS